MEWKWLPSLQLQYFIKTRPDGVLGAQSVGLKWSRGQCPHLGRNLAHTHIYEAYHQNTYTYTQIPIILRWLTT